MGAALELDRRTQLHYDSYRAGWSCHYGCLLGQLAAEAVPPCASLSAHIYMRFFCFFCHTPVERVKGQFGLCVCVCVNSFVYTCRKSITREATSHALAALARSLARLKP